MHFLCLHLFLNLSFWCVFVTFFSSICRYYFFLLQCNNLCSPCYKHCKMFKFLCFLLGSATVNGGVYLVGCLSCLNLILLCSTWGPACTFGIQAETSSQQIFLHYWTEDWGSCALLIKLAITYIMRGKNWHLPKYERPSQGKNRFLINHDYSKWSSLWVVGILIIILVNLP